MKQVLLKPVSCTPQARQHTAHLPPPGEMTKKRMNMWQMLDPLFSALSYRGKHTVRVYTKQKTLINSVQQPRIYPSVPACWVHQFQSTHATAEKGNV